MKNMIDREIVRGWTHNLDLMDLTTLFYPELLNSYQSFLYFSSDFIKKANSHGYTIEIRQDAINQFSFDSDLTKLKPNELYERQLGAFIIKDDVQSLSLYIQDNFDQYLNLPDLVYDYTKIPIICFAAQKNAMKCFKFLLLNGSDPSQISDGVRYLTLKRWNAMAFAASQGNIEMIKILIEHKLKPNKRTAEAAAKFHKNYILKWLITDHNFDKSQLKQAFFQCGIENNLKGLKYCLKAGVDVNVNNKEKNV